MFQENIEVKTEKYFVWFSFFLKLVTKKAEALGRIEKTQSTDIYWEGKSLKTKNMPLPYPYPGLLGMEEEEGKW